MALQLAPPLDHFQPCSAQPATHFWSVAAEVGMLLHGLLPLLLLLSQGPLRKLTGRAAAAARGAPPPRAPRASPADPEQGGLLPPEAPRSDAAAFDAAPPAPLGAVDGAPPAAPSARATTPLRIWVGSWNLGNAKPGASLEAWLPPPRWFLQTLPAAPAPRAGGGAQEARPLARRHPPDSRGVDSHDQ